MLAISHAIFSFQVSQPRVAEAHLKEYYEIVNEARPLSGFFPMGKLLLQCFEGFYPFKLHNYFRDSTRKHSVHDEGPP